VPKTVGRYVEEFAGSATKDFEAHYGERVKQIFGGSTDDFFFALRFQLSSSLMHLSKAIDADELEQRSQRTRTFLEEIIGNLPEENREGAKEIIRQTTFVPNYPLGKSHLGGGR
jgi:hypothetical protein